MDGFHRKGLLLFCNSNIIITSYNILLHIMKVVMEQTAIERVTDAINVLYTETGKRPTLAEVREYLGGGSMTTISEGMKLWRKLRQEANVPVAVVVPENVHDAISATITHLWQQAMATAEARFVSERELMQVEKSELEGRLVEAEEAMTLLESEKDAAQARCASLQQQLKEMEERYQQQETVLATAREEIRQSAVQREQLAQRLEVLDTRLQEAEATNRQQQVALEGAQERLHLAEEQRTQLTRELASVQELVQESEKQLAVTTERLHQQESERNILEQQYHRAQNALLEQQAQYSEAHTQVAVLEAENRLLNKQIEQYGQFLGQAALISQIEPVRQRNSDTPNAEKGKGKPVPKIRKTGGAK